jgi:prolyl oligopeptidase
VAYGLARGGSEDTLLRVVGADDAKDLPFEIDRTRFAAPAWDPDGRTFYYARFPEGGEGAKRYANIRVYRHVLGRETSRDEIVFAPGVGGARDVPEFSWPSLMVPVESRYAYAVVREGARRESAVHVTDRRDLAAGHPAWRKIIAFEDQVTAIEGWKDDLFLLSHHESPRSRVLRMPAKAPDAAAARVAVPQGDAVVEAMALARDALYLRTQVGGVDRLERLQIGLLGTKPADYVRIPFDTAITQLVADPRRPGAILSIEGWVEPPAVVEVEAKSGNLRNTGLAPPANVDYSAMDEVRLYATAHDGEKIPVTMIYPKTTRLTGANPTLLVAYGAYGRSQTPSFDPARLAWLERGGIYAIAHVRGGGEYGEAWHKAAARGSKLTSVLDFISVAEYLVSFGFTRPSRLAIMGTGAGAIPVAGALVRRPDRFAAVVARAPLVDLLSYETMPEGPMSVPEFGSAANAQAAAVLRDISAFHQVKEGASYPAVLFSIGLNDSRVPPWQAARMAARLQAASASGRPVLLRVDPEAGHGTGTPSDRREQELADLYSFLLWQFGDPQFRPQ